MLEHASKKKIWKLTGVSHDTELPLELARSLKLSLVTSRLLVSRGCDSPEAARIFLGKKTEMLHDPFLMKDMDKAVSRIRRALRDNEKIIVYGDYDVDGVTSVTVVYRYLKSLGAHIGYYIPNRIGEGYGVNIDAIRTFVSDGYKLMITVDTGITAIDEVNEAASLGLDTVITDHHECRPELPGADAVVNPRRHDCPYPFKELAGVGVAFKLICAIEMDRCGGSLYDAMHAIADDYCEFAAIGTIADVMPLIDENRITVAYGLSLLENTKNRGLDALMRASGLISFDADGVRIKKKITSSSVGFTLAPRINAAGRISSAEFALELFLTDSDARADEIAAELCETNRRRQSEENSIIEGAQAKIAEQCSPDDYVIVLDDDHWHHGVIGIVSSRITEKYNLPSVLISFLHNMGEEESPEDIGKGSGRSVNGLNLFEALDHCSDLLTKYGGHELAAGLSVERGRLDEFRKKINAFAKSRLEGMDLCRVVDIDLVIAPEDISLKTVNELYLLEPFGTANAQPVFQVDRLIISEVTPLAGGKHTKLTLQAAGLPTVFTALCFGQPTAEFGFAPGEAVDIACSLDINEYRGRQTVQLLVRDIRRSQCVGVPTREDFAALYRELKAPGRVSPVKIRPSELSRKINIPENAVCAMLDVFAELSIIQLYRGEVYEITVLPVSGKIPLESSVILNSLSGKSHI